MNDLKRMEAELAELQARVTGERERVKGETLEAITDMLASGTLTADDLLALLPKTAGAGRPSRSQKRAPMYRDPESGATWTGQGAMPNWLKGVEDRTPYLINGS